MDSVAVIYIPSFINSDLCIQKLMEGYTDTQTGWRSHKPILGK
jgi:hypothetical protein